jgi:hypothetical protein
MKRLALLTASLFVAAPALAADLDGPAYSEAPPRIAERQYYYVPAPSYIEDDDDDDAVVYTYRDRPYYRPYHYGHAYRHPRGQHFRGHRHPHHHGRW